MNISLAPVLLGDDNMIISVSSVPSVATVFKVFT